MENEKNFEQNSVYSKRVRAGKRRTYFFDVRTTKSNDYFITITESKKKFNGDGYDRHKIFIYKEDFMKFIQSMQETIDHVKTELLPDFDFDAVYEHEYEPNLESNENGTKEVVAEEPKVSTIVAPNNNEEVDKWD